MGCKSSPLPWLTSSSMYIGWVLIIQRYWSLLNGDGNITWFDAELTPQGKDQAQTAHTAWSTQLQSHMPMAQSFYVSPLRRCLETAGITFRGVEGFKPVVKEVCLLFTNWKRHQAN